MRVLTQSGLPWNLHNVHWMWWWQTMSRKNEKEKKVSMLNNSKPNPVWKLKKRKDQIYLGTLVKTDLSNQNILWYQICIHGM